MDWLTDKNSREKERQGRDKTMMIESSSFIQFIFFGGNKLLLLWCSKLRDSCVIKKTSLREWRSSWGGEMGWWCWSEREIFFNDRFPSLQLCLLFCSLSPYLHPHSIQSSWREESLTDMMSIIVISRNREGISSGETRRILNFCLMRLRFRSSLLTPLFFHIIKTSVMVAVSSFLNTSPLSSCQWRL